MLEKIDNKLADYGNKYYFMINFFPIFVERVINSPQTIIQLLGPLCLSGICDAYQYLFSLDGNNRYYMLEIENPSNTKGFRTTWISVDYSKDIFDEMYLNKIDLSLSGFALPDNIQNEFERYFKKEWYNKENLVNLINDCLLYFEINQDRDYLNLASKIPKDEIVKRIKDLNDSLSYQSPIKPL